MSPRAHPWIVILAAILPLGTVLAVAWLLGGEIAVSHGVGPGTIAYLVDSASPSLLALLAAAGAAPLFVALGSPAYGVCLLLLFLPFKMFRAAVLPMGVSDSELFLAAIAGGSLARVVSSREELFPRHRVWTWMAAILVWAGLTSIVAANKEDSLRGLVFLATTMLPALLVPLNLRTDRHFKLCLEVIAASAGVEILYALYQWLVVSQMMWFHGIGGTMGNSPELGTYLVTAFPILAAGIFRRKIRRPIRWVYMGLTGACLIVITLTFSRAAYITVTSVGLYAFVTLWKEGKGGPKKLIIGTVLVGTVGVFMLGIPRPARFVANRSKLVTKAIYDQRVAGTLGGSRIERLQLWEAGINILREHPLTGLGIGNWESGYSRYLGDPIREELGAHSNLLQILGELGLVGLILYLGLLLTLFRQEPRISSLRSNSLDAIATRLAVKFAVLSFVVNGIFSQSLFTVRLAIVFWALVGMLIAISRLDQARRLHWRKAMQPSALLPKPIGL